MTGECSRQTITIPTGQNKDKRQNPASERLIIGEGDMRHANGLADQKGDTMEMRGKPTSIKGNQFTLSEMIAYHSKLAENSQTHPSQTIQCLLLHPPVVP